MKRLFSSVMLAILVSSGIFSASNAATCSSLGVGVPDVWSGRIALPTIIVNGQPKLVIECTNDLGIEIFDFHVWAKSASGGGVTQVFQKVDMGLTVPFKKGGISSSQPAFLNNMANFWTKPKPGTGAANNSMIRVAIDLFGDKNYTYLLQATTKGTKSPVMATPIPAAGLLLLSSLSLIGLSRRTRASRRRSQQEA